MALRIGGGRPTAPPVEEELPVEEAPVEEPMPEDLMAELPQDLGEGAMGGGSVSPMIVQYKTAQQRDMEACGSCVHFQQDGSCEIVAGPIDPEGICNIYEDMEAGAPEEEAPAKEPMPEEMPTDEPEPELPAEEMA